MSDLDKGIEIQIDIMDDLKKFFTITPNCLLRGEEQPELKLDFRGYTARARLILGALYSMKSGYRCDRERIDQLAPELGRAAMDTVLKELKTKKNLRTARVNDPKNKGRFIWRWQVSLKPIPESGAGETPGQSIPLQPGYGSSIRGLSSDGRSNDGSSMLGQSAPLIEEEPQTIGELGFRITNRDQNTTPLPPVAANPGVEVLSVEEVEGNESPSDQPQYPIGELVAELKAIMRRKRAEWRWKYIDQRGRPVVRQLLDAGRQFDQVRAGLIRLAEAHAEPGGGPRDILDMAPSWWDAVGPEVAPPPRPVPDEVDEAAIKALLRELRTMRPSWTARSTRPVIEAELEEGMPWPLVAEAARCCAADFDNEYPVRISHPGSWWDKAARKIARAADPDLETRETGGRPLSRATLVERCRLCDHQGHVLDPTRPAGNNHLTLEPLVECDHTPTTQDTAHHLPAQRPAYDPSFEVVPSPGLCWKCQQPTRVPLPDGKLSKCEPCEAGAARRVKQLAGVS